MNLYIKQKQTHKHNKLIFIKLIFIKGEMPYIHHSIIQNYFISLKKMEFHLMELEFHPFLSPPESLTTTNLVLNVYVQGYG